MSQNNAIILAGGQGKRMKAMLPKPMFTVLGKPMLQWVIDACKKADIDDLCILKGYMSEVIDEYIDGKFDTALQDKRLGTGHAVMQCADFIKKTNDGNVLVLCGDAPFVDAKTIKNALELHIKEDNAVTVISGIMDNPYGYGRIIRSRNNIAGIVEEKDCTDNQRKVNEVNSGVYWFKASLLNEALSELEPSNAQGEYYLTDTISILLSKNHKANAYVSENEYFSLGANDRKGLLELNNIARMSVIEKHMENGVSFTCTDGITIEADVQIGANTEILQGTILKGNTVIGENSTIGPNCLFDNTTVGDNTILNYVQSYDAIIEDNVKIGPFVHIRPNSHIKSGVKIGDFVEVKNSVIGENTAVAHLTYVGDSDVGSKVNFGCGCVTVNYDGAKKARCTIGDGAFIGCNTNLIAPVSVGEGAYTAAGSTITKKVPDHALAIERSEFKIKEGYALRKLKRKK